MRVSSFLFLCLLIFSCTKEKAPPKPQKEEAPDLKVTVMKAKKVNVSLSSELFGRVLSTNEAEIRPQVSGIILERLFEEGKFVKKGQKLYQIDPARYQVAYNIAQGKLEQTKAKLFSAKSLIGRYRTLIKKNAISKQEFDNAQAAFTEAQANVQVAEAQVVEAKINLDYTKVYSPIDGYVGKSLVTKGALVTANQPQVLTTVRSLDPVYVDLSFPASDAIHLRERLGKYLVKSKDGKGLTVSLKIDELNQDYPYKGNIEARELSLDKNSGSMNLRAIVPNPKLMLLPGMFVKAYVDQLGYGNKLVVPQTAVIRDQNGDANVWVVSKEGQVERRRIETGIMYRGNWIVEKGVTTGDTIALDQFSKLSSGMSVDPEPLRKEAQTEREKK